MLGYTNTIQIELELDWTWLNPWCATNIRDGDTKFQECMDNMGRADGTREAPPIPWNHEPLSVSGGFSSLTVLTYTPNMSPDRDPRGTVHQSNVHRTSVISMIPSWMFSFQVECGAFQRFRTRRWRTDTRGSQTALGVWGDFSEWVWGIQYS